MCDSTFLDEFAKEKNLIVSKLWFIKQLLTYFVWLVFPNTPTDIRLPHLPNHIHQVRPVDRQSWTRFQLFQSLISCKFKFILQSWCNREDSTMKWKCYVPLFCSKLLKDFWTFVFFIPVLDFWWCLPWVSKPAWISDLRAFCLHSMDSSDSPWYDTWQWSAEIFYDSHASEQASVSLAVRLKFVWVKFIDWLNGDWKDFVVRKNFLIC